MRERARSRTCDGPEVHRLLELLYFMAPAYLANMAPPFLKYWRGWNRPISLRWLGAHKTVGGFVLGVLVALAVAYAQSVIGWEGGVVSYAQWPLVGLAMGIGALGGDAIKSAFKRAHGIAPGKPWIPADQLDFVLGALALVGPWAPLGWVDVAIIIGVSFAGDLAVNQIAFRLGIRNTPL